MAIEHPLMNQTKRALIRCIEHECSRSAEFLKRARDAENWQQRIRESRISGLVERCEAMEKENALLKQDAERDAAELEVLEGIEDRFERAEKLITAAGAFCERFYACLNRGGWERGPRLS